MQNMQVDGWTLSFLSLPYALTYQLSSYWSLNKMMLPHKMSYNFSQDNTLGLQLV